MEELDNKNRAMEGNVYKLIWCDSNDKITPLQVAIIRHSIFILKCYWQENKIVIYIPTSSIYFVR